MAQLERDIQSRIVRSLEERLPGVYLFKGDTRYKQGTPDLIILYGDRWAMLEVKKSATARKQPNQDYYVEQLNNLSYAAVIHPGNEKEILDEVQHILQAPRGSCLLEPE